MKDGSPFVFLWEGWQNTQTQEWLRTCTIITGQPNELVAEIHTRTPVILPGFWIQLVQRWRGRLLHLLVRNTVFIPQINTIKVFVIYNQPASKPKRKTK